MAQITFGDDGIEVDGAAVAEAMGLSPEQLRAGMRSGGIAAVCERGLGEDAGTYRLSFVARDRRLRLIVDGAGAVVRRSLLKIADPPSGARLDLRRFPRGDAQGTLQA